MRKWVAGILAAVIGGVLIWLLTDRLLPRWLDSSAGPVEPNYQVACYLNPPRISAGQRTEVLVKVTRDGVPLEGAVLEIGAGAGRFEQAGNIVTGVTSSGGTFRATWNPPPGARDLNYAFDVVLKDVSSYALAMKYRETSSHAECTVSVGG